MIAKKHFDNDAIESCNFRHNYAFKQTTYMLYSIGNERLIVNGQFRTAASQDELLPRKRRSSFAVVGR